MYLMCCHITYVGLYYGGHNQWMLHKSRMLDVANLKIHDNGMHKPSDEHP